jgi:uncharacterized protein YfdQ (DUF2303 family)
MKTENPAASPSTYSADAITLLQSLAQEASMPMLLPVEMQSEGLPKKVFVGWDRKAQRFISLKGLVEEWREAPRRREGTAKANTLASLIDLVNRHAEKEQAVLFAETRMPSPSITAVLDYHAKGKAPAALKHRVQYAFPLTEEFKAWVEMNKKPMEQAAFSRFLEDHAAELVAPMDGERSEFERLFKERMATPAELITLSRELEIYVNHHIKRVERPKTGERQVVFVEEQNNGKGEPVDIPGVFMISVVAFMDGAQVRIPARLRFRVGGGEIKWHFDLYRLDHWIREQVVNDLALVADKTGLPAYEGKPEAGE